jgi:hypothetical protein
MKGEAFYTVFPIDSGWHFGIESASAEAVAEDSDFSLRRTESDSCLWTVYTQFDERVIVTS